METLFYILCLERGPWGNEAVWWGPSNCGYYANLDAAGRYSEAEARKIATPTDIPIPCDDADEVSSRTVHFDRVGILKRRAPAWFSQAATPKSLPEINPIRTVLASTKNLGDPNPIAPALNSERVEGRV